MERICSKMMSQYDIIMNIIDIIIIIIILIMTNLK